MVKGTARNTSVRRYRKIAERFSLAIATTSICTTAASAQDFDSYQFLEGHLPGSPLYHISLHVHFKEPYDGGPQSLNFPQQDWYIGGLSFFRRNQIRGPIVVGSLKTDHAAKVLGFPETELGTRKPIDYKLAKALVDSAIYLKNWLPEMQFPYSGIPIRGVGLTSNSIVKAVLVKNNAYHLWEDVKYQHIAPGTGPDDPGIPGFTEEPLKSPMIGEWLFWGIMFLLALAMVFIARKVLTVSQRRNRNYIEQ